jgi:hypothetical protein
MNLRPKIRLSRLRDIGWSKWDPIGLLADGENWEGKPFADEYDAYLLRAAGMCRQGQTIEAVARYLVQIETDHIRLSYRTGIEERARAVVLVIQSDEKLWREE